MVLAQTAADYGEALAMVIGAAFILLPLLYLAATWAPGREGDERRHEKAIQRGLRWFGATEQAQATAVDEGVLADCRYLADSQTKAGWLARPKNWLRRRVSPTTVVIHGKRITDANDDPIHVLSVDRYRLAHRDLDQLLADAETVLDARLDRERVPATLSERYYDDITDGFVDLAEFQRRIEGDCYTRIESNMKKNERLDEDELRERLVFDDGFRYPKPVFVRKLQQRIENGDIRRIPETGELVWEHY